MINYIKNFLLFLILSMSITGCVSKYNDGTKNSSYKIQDKSSMYQSASLENIIIQRDMKLKKYKQFINKSNSIKIDIITESDNDSVIDVLYNNFKNLVSSKNELKDKLKQRLNNNLSICIKKDNIIIGVYLLNKKSIIINIKPNIIINCAGIIPQNSRLNNYNDYIRINTLFPHIVNNICKNNNF